MSLFLLDTDTVSLLQQGNLTVQQHVNSHSATEVFHSAITLQEQMKGFLASVNSAPNHQQLALSYDRLVLRLLPTWSRFAVLSFTESAMLRFDYLRTLRLNIGSMDLRIAGIALENNLTVVTRNLRDFGRVPGLTCVDWSV
jgi:tRNA(fMet)-specific endonuclease VapC